MKVNTLEHRVLIVPGLRGSGASHWQTLWERANPQYRRVMQRNWEYPDVDEWAETIEEAVQESTAPALLVAHSFGCLAVARNACRNPSRIAGALFVAPADPDRFAVGVKISGEPFSFPSFLVGSTSDPWLTLDRGQELAACWGSRFINLGDVGHINAESGFGTWPYGEHLLHKLAVLAGVKKWTAPHARLTVAARSSPLPHEAALRNSLRMS